MDVTQTQTTPPIFSGQNQADTQTEVASESGGTSLSSDFETFLRMLTVQMENQDPLNPIDSADYAVQLATFSSVEQQVMTNDLLTSLTSALTGGGLGALGQWVGMEVRGSAKANYSGSPIDLQVPTNVDADRRLLVIRDESDQIIARLDLDLTTQEAQWDGRLNNGSPAQPGLYDFKVESYSEGALIDSVEAETYAMVTEARLENGETRLILEGGVPFDASKISALRQPQGELDG